MINCAKDTQSVFFQYADIIIVFNDLYAMQYIQAGRAVLVMLITNCLTYLVCYVFYMSIRIMMNCSLNSAAVIMTKHDHELAA